MSLSDMSPAEIDTELAEIWGKRAQAVAQIAAASRYIGRRGYDQAYHQGRIDTLKAEIDVLNAEAAPFEAEYATRPWNRYFLVENNNGHVHRGMDCSTCFPTTMYAWLIDLADCDEDKMVEEWGERACTVCFPNAPVNPNFNRPSRRDREAMAARAADKAVREAAKAAKAITAPDGRPLRDHNGSTLRTKVAARNELSWMIECASLYGANRESRNGKTWKQEIARIAEALDAAGVESEPIIERACKRNKVSVDVIIK